MKTLLVIFTLILSQVTWAQTPLKAAPFFKTLPLESCAYDNSKSFFSMLKVSVVLRSSSELRGYARAAYDMSTQVCAIDRGIARANRLSEKEISREVEDGVTRAIKEIFSNYIEDDEDDDVNTI